MTDIETRLREAMRTEAGQASPERLRELRPLPEATARRRAGARGWLGPGAGVRGPLGLGAGVRGWFGPGAVARGWLVPAAAALAIVAVIALVSVGVRTATTRPGQPAPKGVSTEKSVWPAAGTVRPPYFAEFGNETNSQGRVKPGTYVMIYSSGTGALLCTVQVPGAKNQVGAYPFIAVTGDDRHFLLEAPAGSQADPVSRFWWMAVSADGRHATVSPAALPAGPAGLIVTGIALTADGSKAAVAWGTQPWAKKAPGITAEVQVIELATGAVQTWTTRQGNITDNVATINSLSWGTGDRLLGFQWSEGWAGELRQGGYFLLDTGERGAGLLARRIVADWAGGRSLVWGFLAGPADSVIASVTLPVPGKSHLPGRGSSAVVEFSARTGQIVRTLYGPGRFQDAPDYYVASIDPSGQHVLVSLPQLARIDHGVVTPFHVPATEDVLGIFPTW